MGSSWGNVLIVLQNKLNEEGKCIVKSVYHWRRGEGTVQKHNHPICLNCITAHWELNKGADYYHTHTHIHTHFGFGGLWGFSIGVIYFIWYKNAYYMAVLHTLEYLILIGHICYIVCYSEISSAETQSHLGTTIYMFVCLRSCLVPSCDWIIHRLMYIQVFICQLCL